MTILNWALSCLTVVGVACEADVLAVAGLAALAYQLLW